MAKKQKDRRWAVKYRQMYLDDVTRMIFTWPRAMREDVEIAAKFRQQSVADFIRCAVSKDLASFIRERRGLSSFKGSVGGGSP